jgi:hypothetical protein
MGKLLTIDLSTTCTGWSVWDLETKKLEDYGFIKPNKKGMSKLEYPQKQLRVMQDIAVQILQLVYRIDGFSIEGSSRNIQMILIEEVNLHKSRLSGKTLDGMHWILMQALSDDLNDKYIARVRYRDSDGPLGWRTRLGLHLSEMDKKLNAERRRLNAKLKSKDQLPIINKKHLAARYVNSALGLSFDVDQDPTANDVVDAIGLGLSELLTLK